MYTTDTGTIELTLELGSLADGHPFVKQDTVTIDQPAPVTAAPVLLETTAPAPVLPEPTIAAPTQPEPTTITIAPETTASLLPTASSHVTSAAHALCEISVDRASPRKLPSPKRLRSGSVVVPQPTLDAYRTRLLDLPSDAFVPLDGVFVSLYGKQYERASAHGEGRFPTPWLECLREVASSKGATIMGTLPHYRGKSKEFKVRPDIKTRFYVGDANSSSREPASIFSVNYTK